MTLIIGLTLFVVSISFLCSLLEAVFLSITPAYVSQLESKNPKIGKILERLKDNAERPISAILTINTVAHTTGSAFVATVTYEIFGNTMVSVISAVLTFAILIFGEIIPKILGTVYWRKLAPFAAFTIQLYIMIVYPIVWLSEVLGKILKPKLELPEVTRADVIATAEVGVDEGTLHSKESGIIKNLLMLSNMYVSDIMTPRSVIFALDSTMTVEEVFERYRPIRFSRIPVYEGSLDNIIGMTMRFKIHECMSSDHHDTKIKTLTSPINSVSERMTINQVIDNFIKHKEHMALAVDEYGVVTGLVTLEDAIETLLGVEIVDELDHSIDMRQYALEQWQQRKSQLRKN